MNRELDAELKKAEPAKAEPAPKTLEEAVEKQLRLFGERFSDKINIAARSRLSGIRRMFVFDNSPKGTDKGKICVAVVYSDKTRKVANAMFTQDHHYCHQPSLVRRLLHRFQMMIRMRSQCSCQHNGG